jgi:DNA end-binding protein Ku
VFPEWSFRVPASRPSWKGYIKLALVSCPVALWPATAPSERISFRQINKKTGNRIRYQNVDEGTGQPVASEDKGKGYELDKNQYLMIDEEELKAIEIESTRTIEIDSFVPRGDIDERYLDSPYYIAPNESVGAEAFAVIREAMRDKSMAALARVVLSSRERVIMLQPWDKGMLGTTVRYPYELRNSDEYFRDIPEVKIDRNLLQLAEHILQSKAAPFNPDAFVDRYERAVIDLIKAKQAGMPESIRHALPAPRTTTDLMDALKRSLEKSLPLSPANDAKPAQAAKAKKAKPRNLAQGELLLPIPGKKPAAEATKLAPKAAPGRRKAS